MKNCASPLERGFRGSRLSTAELEMEFYGLALLNYGMPQTRGIRYTDRLTPVKVPRRKILHPTSETP